MDRQTALLTALALLSIAGALVTLSGWRLTRRTRRRGDAGPREGAS